MSFKFKVNFSLLRKMVVNANYLGQMLGLLIQKMHFASKNKHVILLLCEGFPCYWFSLSKKLSSHCWQVLVSSRNSQKHVKISLSKAFVTTEQNESCKISTYWQCTQKSLKQVHVLENKVSELKETIWLNFLNYFNWPIIIA